MEDGSGMLKVGNQNSVRLPSDGQPSLPTASILPEESTTLTSGRVRASNGLTLEWKENAFRLKEHDYMGLVEDSASKQSPPADADADDAVGLGGADLHLELGLGLGVASSRKDDCEKYADFLVNEKDGIFKPQKGTSTEPIERVSGAAATLRMSWNYVHAIIADGPTASSRTTLDCETSKTIPACAQDFLEVSSRAGLGTCNGSNAKNGTKRAYTEAMHDAARFDIASGEPVVGILGQGEAKLPPRHQQGASLSSWPPPSKPSGPAIWAAASEKSSTQAFVSSNGKMPLTNATRPFTLLEFSKESISNISPPSKGQVVGWPPIRSYRKQNLAKSTEMYVKVNMDGMTVGRKVDLNAHGSYEGLYLALEEMFQLSIDGGRGTAQSVQGRESRFQEGKQIRLLNGSEYVLTYEDQDGDWMMVGDVPWGMFVGMVRRLRITRKSGATGLTLPGDWKLSPSDFCSV